MKVLVSGGAGFVGSHIAEAYRDLGHQVVILDNFSTGKRENLPSNVRVVEMDIRDSELSHFLAQERFDVVNHHAALMSVEMSLRQPVEYASANVMGTVNLLQAAVQAGVRKFIFASSGGTIYGEQVVHPCDENHPTRPLTPYGVSKLAGEHFVNCIAAVSSLQAVNLRYGNVYGPRQNTKGESNVIALFIDKLLHNMSPTIFGDGTHTRDYIYISDVVRLNCLLLERPIVGTFNVGTGIERTVRDVFDTIARNARACIEPQYGPERIEQSRVCLSSKQLEYALGWRPLVTFEEGIHQTVEWFRSHQSHDEKPTEFSLPASTCTCRAAGLGNRS